MRTYKVIFHDKFGTEKTEIHSDGSNLKTTLRGIDFEGDCFETLEGKLDKEKFEYLEFEGYEGVGDLTNCKFIVDIIIKIEKKGIEISEILNAEITTGKDIGGSGLILILKTGHSEYKTSKKFGFFEDALVDIQDQLPEDTKMKTCLSCKYAHYNPYGNGMFGGLYCFREMKEMVDEVNSKGTLFQMFEIAGKENKVFNVQETFDCEEHSFITDNDWNYSNWK